MMATVPHVTSGSGLIKFQADGFLFDRVYQHLTFLERLKPLCLSASHQEVVMGMEK